MWDIYQDQTCWAHMLNVLHEGVLSCHSQQILHFFNVEIS